MQLVDGFWLAVDVSSHGFFGIRAGMFFLQSGGEVARYVKQWWHILF